MEKIKMQDWEVSLLFEIGHYFTNSTQTKNILAIALKKLSQSLSFESAFISIVNRNSDERKLEEAYNLPTGNHKATDEVIDQVINSGNPMVLKPDPKSFTKDENSDYHKKPNGATSFFCIPVKFKNEVLGVIGAYRFVEQNFDYDKIVRILTVTGIMMAQTVREMQEVSEESIMLQKENHLPNDLNDNLRSHQIIGTSKAIQESFSLIKKVVKTNATVLIRGESGVGKELFANAIHDNSDRADKKFVKVNCSALPETLIESELFGHEKGAFTGADKLRKGRFEVADGGSIFLDEIGDLPLATQVKILRILQEKEFERLGSTETIKIDVRIIAATNRDLDELIKEGKFREDLYYRLNVFPVFVPPLRDRRSDITLLADFFVEKFNKKNNKSIKRISTSAIDMLMSYHWPGNVRELENCIERASILCNEDVIYGYHLPPSLQIPNEESPKKGALQNVLDNMEKELIKDTLKLTKGNITRAAVHLGITERMMGIRIKKYHIDAKRYKNTKN